MYGRISKIVISILLTTVSFLQVAVGQDLKILALRVDFIADNHEGTTGNGKFLLSNEDNNCGNIRLILPLMINPILNLN